MDAELLVVNNLKVDIKTGNQYIGILENVNFKVLRGQKVAVLGPSGTGKTTLLESIGQLKSWDSHYRYAGEIRFSGHSLLENKKLLHQYRGNKFSYIFQEPMSCFNPLLTCGKQVDESISAHRNAEPALRKKMILEWFEKFKLGDVSRVFDAYPHQLSGGQLQRIMFVLALINGPELLIADEPYSSLDEENQLLFLKTLEEEQKERNLSVIMVSHDWLISKNWADYFIIMNHGTIVDQGDLQTLEKTGSDPFTTSLFEFEQVREKLAHDFSVVKHAGEPVLQVEKVSKSYPSYQTSNENTDIFENINFELFQGETIGVSGPSGSGKSTLARCILKLEKTDAGKIFWMEKDVTHLDFETLIPLRPSVQIVFQDNNLSLPPHKTIYDILYEVSRIQKGKKVDVMEILGEVGLDDTVLMKYPSQLSGGQRQRLCIARALAMFPKVIVFDEILSMLDPVSQVQIVNLLLNVQKKSGISFVFITHDKKWLEVFTRRVIDL
ncbi:MAG: ABC transporter ATP-binding protein [Saprospiraceae bacterium]|nr:ABC transporter ATP-binding protein [Saprospiraceae bacterium]MBK8855920.1 ABC transporter ATP-binding protein [Saprospiraceae bacterium]